MSHFLLIAIVFLPLVAALLVMFYPQRAYFAYKATAIAVNVFQLLAVLWLVLDNTAAHGPHGLFVHVREHWFTLSLGTYGQLSASLFLGIDGLNNAMALLTGIVMLIGVISSLEISEKQRGFYTLYMLLSGTVMGCFLALDFFLFFLFFEFMLLPMYFLIGIWGGKRKHYAAIKFYIYTLIGSIFILIILIALSVSVIDPQATAVRMGLLSAGQPLSQEMLLQVQQLLAAGKMLPKDMVRTFDVMYMADAANFIPDSVLSLSSSRQVFGMPVRLVAFLLLFVGFAIKLPVVPLHTWLPDAHVEAPTCISVVLAGVLLKIGGYGLLRFAYGVFPDGGVYFAWWIGLLGVFSIVYAAFVALGTHNLKRLIAYSSVSHMGFVLLGISAITSEGFSGAIFQMFSHGIISSMLFLLAGVLYSRVHDLEIAHFGGLATHMPRYAFLMTVGFFASLGLPGFSGFMAELFVFIGAFSSFSVNHLLPRWMPILATAGLVLGAAYYLWALQRVMLGKFYVHKEGWAEKLVDVTFREGLILFPLAVITTVLGVYPQSFLNLLQQTVAVLADFVNTHGVDYLAFMLR